MLKSKHGDAGARRVGKFSMSSSTGGSKGRVAQGQLQCNGVTGLEPWKGLATHWALYLLDCSGQELLLLVWRTLPLQKGQHRSWPVRGPALHPPEEPSGMRSGYTQDPPCVYLLSHLNINLLCACAT